LTSFTRQGNYWVASGQTEEGALNLGAGCSSGYPRCNYPEMFFMNDSPLKHVASLENVVTGTYFFDYAADKIYFLDDPTGKKVEVAVTPLAISGAAVNVTIQNLIIEKYGNQAQYGAIGGQYSGSGWTVQNNEVRYNHGAGVFFSGSWIVRGNNVHHNGQIGIVGWGTSPLVEKNVISFNNIMGFNVRWEAGGTKFSVTTGLIARCNLVSNNWGPGLWTDIDNINTLYDRNLVVNNTGEGIVHEISYDATITGNIVKGNSNRAADFWLYGAQILISASRNVEVYDNIVETGGLGGNGITVLQQARGSGAYGPYLSQGNYIHNNKITYLYAWNGSVEPHSGVATDTDFVNFWATYGSTNHFDYNNYHLVYVPGHTWARNDTFLDWNGIRAAGEELHSTFDGNVVLDTSPFTVSSCN